MDVVLLQIIRPLFPILFLFSGMFAGAQKSFVPAAPYSVKVTQPDGTELELRGMGDEYRHIAVTPDGYTVMKNARGFYEFARRNEAGKLDLSGIRARNKGERTPAEVTFLRSAEKYLSDTSAAPDERLKSAEAIQAAFPSSGTRKALLLLIEYPDWEHAYPASDFERLMNEENYNGTGSFSDYFDQASNGKLALSVDVQGWYRAENNYEYYGENAGDDRARELVAEAVDAAEAAGVDFSEYDNDGDGIVDNLIIAHAGPGAEEGSQKEYIWSHSWSLGTYTRFYDGVTIRPYIIQPETRRFGMVGIGVFCHEFGHALGLPDLYDVDGSSEGLGEWCLMASGSWLNQEKTPAMLSAWGREELGWIEPVVIDSDGDYSLSPAAAGDACYKLLTPESEEYFLLENRNATGFDAALPGTGLAIFHVNAGRHDNNEEALKLTDLEEADGRDDLDKNNNRGDDGDLFPGSSFNTFFNDASYPDSKNYNGLSSGVGIFNIAEEGTVLHFSTGTRVIDGIDLLPGTGENELVVDGTLVQADFQVTNGGNQSSGPFYVACYLSEDQSLSTSDVFIGRELVAELSAGQSIIASFSKDVAGLNPEVPPGEYYVGSIIDYQDEVSEVAEDNNAFSFTGPLVNVGIQPDLTFVPGENHIGITGTSIDISLRLTNAGETASPPGNIAFYLSENVPVSTSGFFLGEVDFSSMDAGDSRGYSFSAPVASLDGQLEGGDYYAGYIIDSDDRIAESDENNNGHSFSDDVFHYCPPAVTFLTEALCSGDSLVYNGEVIKKSGVYEYEYQSEKACDSLVVLEVTVNPSEVMNRTETICRGESLFLGDREITKSGIYSASFSNVYGCDSTVTLDVHVVDPVQTVLDERICAGDSVEVGGIYYSEPGVYTHSLVSRQGCDSTVVMNLTVTHPSDTLITRSVCSGDSVMVGDRVYKKPGIFRQVFTSRMGCDSLVTLDLRVKPEQDILLKKTICPGDSVFVGPFVYHKSGVFENTFSNRFGCDSLVTLQLEVAPLPEIDLGPDRIMYTSGTVLLDPGPGYADYSWNTGDVTPVLRVDPSAGPGVHTFGVTVTNAYGCSVSDAVEVTIFNDAFSLTDPERNLKLFPNPGNGRVNLLIQQVTGAYQVIVYSGNGTVVYQNEFSSPGKKFVKPLDLSFLTSGIYSLHVHSGDEVLAEKLMIFRN